MKLTVRLVLLAFGRGACSKGSELFRSDFLEDFVSARITGVGIDEEQRLDFRHAGNDPSDSDEFAEMGAADGSDGQNVVGAWWAEIDVAVCENGSRCT